jgi:aspartyl-tRNA(Asn)/glutamyl-tRNA(Gln) amidotransferase subunit C
MQLSDIKKLAELARLDMPEEEMMALLHDFDSILSYVGQVQEVSESSLDKEEYLLVNVMREDIVTNPTSTYTSKIIEQMPDSQDGFLKVKQIL